MEGPNGCSLFDLDAWKNLGMADFSCWGRAVKAGERRTPAMCILVQWLLRLALGFPFLWLMTQSLEEANPARPAAQPPQPEQAIPIERAEPVAADLHGDPLPAGAMARLGTRRWRPGQESLLVLYTPDGRQLVTAGADGALALWDGDSGRLVRRFGTFLGTTDLTAVTANGRTLATFSGGEEVAFWEVAAGRELRRIKLKAPGGARERLGAGARLALAPDGKTLATIDTMHVVAQWDTATGKQLRTFVSSSREARGAPRRVRFAPDGKKIVVTYWLDGRLSSSLDSSDKGGAIIWDRQGTMPHRPAGAAENR
jgi:WD40 repeat protein